MPDAKSDVELEQHLIQMGMTLGDLEHLSSTLFIDVGVEVELVVFDLLGSPHESFEHNPLPKFPNAHFAAYADIPKWIHASGIHEELEDIVDTVQASGTALLILHNRNYIVLPLEGLEAGPPV